MHPFICLNSAYDDAPVMLRHLLSPVILINRFAGYGVELKAGFIF